jgi:outer membrane protein insertion porin family
VTIQVAERPWIAAVEFRGLKSLGGDRHPRLGGLREGAPLNPQRVKDAERLVRDRLAKKGLQLTSIDTSLVAMPRPAEGYRLVFNVREGSRLTLAAVDFRGNQAFSDDELTGAMKTKPEGFWWFRSGRFDREAFEADLRESLPEFYADRGYIDFAVLGDTLEVDPATGAGRLVVDVREGPQYRLGEFIIQGASHFPHEELERLFLEQHRSVLGLPVGGTSQRMAGEVFDRARWTRRPSRSSSSTATRGTCTRRWCPTWSASPRGGAAAAVNATIAVSERQPFYVRHIAFEGNTTTHEQVLRDRLWLLPGDVYDEAAADPELPGAQRPGLLRDADAHPRHPADPDSGVVDIVFHVKEKQTGNINFGTVIGGGYAGRGGGVSGFLGYQQPNLFGQGKNASLRLEYGYGRSTVEASYSDPSLGGSRTSGSFSVFRTGDRFISTNNGRRLRTGASTQFGFPLPGAPRTRMFVGYTLSKTTYTAFEDPCLGQTTNVFCLPAATASQLSLSLVRDTKNHPLFPTAGTRQSLSLSQTGGPLGGDGNFQQAAGRGRVVGAGGADRHRAAPDPLRAGAERARRHGVRRREPLPLREVLRGRRAAGRAAARLRRVHRGPARLHPRVQGTLATECLGDSFVTLSAEYAVRLNDMLSLHVFGDAGNVFNDVNEFNPTRLFRGAGVGGTIVTPFLGAIGVDAAYGFDRPVPGWEIHFKLGTGF